MDANHNVNWNSIIQRKGVRHRTEIEGPFLAAKDLNTNFVQFLSPNHVIISNVLTFSFMCTISHMHGSACKMVLCAQNLMYKKLWYIKAYRLLINQSIKIHS